MLNGGAGNDYLKGGAVQDTMTGGTGSDGFGFAFATGDSNLNLASMDQITDFNATQDRLIFHFATDQDAVHVLTSNDTPAVGSGNSYASLLEAAEAQSARVVIGYDNAQTYVFVDTDNNGSIDLAVKLVGIKGQSAAGAISFGYVAL